MFAKTVDQFRGENRFIEHRLHQQPKLRFPFLTVCLGPASKLFVNVEMSHLVDVGDEKQVRMQILVDGYLRRFAGAAAKITYFGLPCFAKLKTKR